MKITPHQNHSVVHNAYIQLVSFLFYLLSSFCTSLGHHLCCQPGAFYSHQHFFVYNFIMVNSLTAPNMLAESQSNLNSTKKKSDLLPIDIEIIIRHQSLSFHDQAGSALTHLIVNAGSWTGCPIQGFYIAYIEPFST